MGPGKPYDELSEKERATQRSTHVYSDDGPDALPTDLGGRRLPQECVVSGMHEAFAGHEHHPTAHQSTARSTRIDR